MNGVRKTSATVSGAVMEFMKENSLELNAIAANLVREKIFTDKKEYTVELYKKTKSEPRNYTVSDADIDTAKSILEKMLSLMRFNGFKLETRKENDIHIIKIATQNKDGLLIGKNGQNLLAIQYLVSMIMDKQLKRHIPLLIDVDAYRDKRIAYLKNLSRTMGERAIETQSEVITDFLPSYERKLIHEEITHSDGLKTFSVGKGSYKKVVITTLL